MGELVLKVRDLPEGVSEHGFELSGSWLEAQLGDLPDVAPGGAAGKVVLEATREGKQVLLRGAAEATLSLTCVRCLEAFETFVRADVDVLMRPGDPEKNRSAEELELEDLGEEYYQGDVIVLDDLVRDLLVLEVPMNPSCGEACPGPDVLTERPRKE